MGASFCHVSKIRPDDRGCLALLLGLRSEMELFLIL